MFSIVICTKDRPTDLERCIMSLLAARHDESRDEILIIDDGTTPQPVLARIEERAAEARFPIVYHRKSISDGLYNSRRLAARLARGEVVVFLDDDTTVGESFLSLLRAHFDADPSLVGVGAVDPGTRSNLGPYVYGLFFLMASTSPGRLSLSGMNGSLYRWHQQRAPFSSEYFMGFCMSYRRHAITDLAPIPWLVGYSLAEDLFVSTQARRHGPLLVDPALPVVHHLSGTNRLGPTELRRQMMLRAVRMAAILRPSRTGRIAAYWSLLGLALGPAFRLQPRETAAALRTFAQILAGGASRSDSNKDSKGG